MGNQLNKNSYAPILRKFNLAERKRGDGRDMIQLYGLNYDSKYLPDLILGVDGAHYHAFWELHLPVKGQAQYRVGDRNVTVRAGQLILIAPKTTHCPLPGGGYSPRFGLLFSASENSTFLPYVEMIREEGYLILDDANAELDAMNLLFDTVRIGEDDSVERLQCCLHLFFYSLKHSIERHFGEIKAVEEIKARATGSDFFEQIQQYIRDHISQPITCEEVAERMFISGRHLNRRLSERYRMTFREMLELARVNYATDLLCYTDLSIEDIARQSGFGSASAFIRFFSREKGITPAAYRKDLMSGSADNAKT